MNNMAPFRAWAEINLDAADNNIRAVRSAVSPGVKILAVVKADAYGHGAVEMSRVFLAGGADILGVASLEEALALKHGGIKAPVFLLSGAYPLIAGDLVENDIVSAVFDLDMARALSTAAQKAGKTAKIHIKIDTGMNRLGFLHDSEKALDEIERLFSLPALDTEGIFTHFACADEQDESFTRLQFKRFTEIIEKIESRGHKFRVRHCCNSAGVLRFPEMHLDMVRPGIILYGSFPSPFFGEYDLSLRPVMCFCARVAQLKSLKKGGRVSYGGVFTAPRDMEVGVVSAGYADGYSRALSEKAKILYAGKKVDVLGKICMDLCMFDASNVHNISEGDSVVLFGEKDGQSIRVEELSDILGTISYEILCKIGSRVPRVYISNNTLKSIRSHLYDGTSCI